MSNETASSSTGDASAGAQATTAPAPAPGAATTAQPPYTAAEREALAALVESYAGDQPYVADGTVATPQGTPVARAPPDADPQEAQTPYWRTSRDRRSLSVPVPASPVSQRQAVTPPGLSGTVRLPALKVKTAAAPPEDAAASGATGRSRPETHHIGSPPGRQTRGDRSDVEPDKPGADESGASEKLLEKMSEVILVMNAQVAALSKRLEDLDRERARRDDPDKLAKINHKDISKPTKFPGGGGWTVWSKNFTTFLERRDQRWPKLLGAIAKRSAGPPLNEDIKVAIAREAGILDKDDLEAEFANQLYDYLQEFTSGDALAAVIAGGKQGCWETWRYLSEQGKSRQKNTRSKRSTAASSIPDKWS